VRGERAVLPTSFLAQRGQRVDPGGTSGGDEGGAQGNGHDSRRRHGIGGRIGRFNPDDEPSDVPGD